MTQSLPAKQRYFLVGPLRTGSSLLTRCIDDHPEAICLCESEINRALFGEYLVTYHCWRMNAHGMTTDEAIRYLDYRKQDDFASLEGWYDQVQPSLCDLFQKPESALLGDKSPDFHRSPELVPYLAQHHRLIYTTRDPHAIFASIDRQTDSTLEEKVARWENLITNYHRWSPYLDSENVLVIRYEDLIRMPRLTMHRVYRHLGLPDSDRFLTPFPRRYPLRFLWDTAVDWETGVHKDFDQRRISAWSARLTEDHIHQVRAHEAIIEFMVRFGYV